MSKNMDSERMLHVSRRTFAKGSAARAQKAVEKCTQNTNEVPKFSSTPAVGDLQVCEFISITGCFENAAKDNAANGNKSPEADTAADDTAEETPWLQDRICAAYGGDCPPRFARDKQDSAHSGTWPYTLFAQLGRSASGFLRSLCLPEAHDPVFSRREVAFTERGIVPVLAGDVLFVSEARATFQHGYLDGFTHASAQRGAAAPDDRDSSFQPHALKERGRG
ncbi:hypothetical protein CDD83_1417 [Cordyceps sp. RAO-2017]|nr:hypothetical protein CDD83_1417 [Cordyceps sp. RAO-2017]